MSPAEINSGNLLAKTSSVEKNIFVAGHMGLVGSAICRIFNQHGISIFSASRADLDLRDESQVKEYLFENKIDEVYLAAAKVGGIEANRTYPISFLEDNLRIQLSVFRACFSVDVKRLLFLGSSCIYPKFASQPITEDCLLTGSLEPTNEYYAVAKIAGIKLMEAYMKEYGAMRSLDYRCLMPTNLYGPRDNFHPQNSHVIPGLIRRFYDAKMSGESSVEVWGDGNTCREFLYSEDLARACIHIMNIPRERYGKTIAGSASFLNVGSGCEVTVKELSNKVANTVGYEGELVFNNSMPSGTPRKLLDSSKIQTLGWTPSVSLDTGLDLTYRSFLDMGLSC